MTAAQGPTTGGGTAPKPRRLVATTAIVTFFVTSIGQYLLTAALDAGRTASTPAIVVESQSPSAVSLNVVVPPLEQFEQLEVPYDAAAVTRWALNAGGGPADQTYMDLRVWGQRDRPIVLRGVRAEIVRCSPAPPWPVIIHRGGGDIAQRSMLIDLDGQSLQARGLANALTEQTFTFPLSVSRSDLESFNVRTTTKRNCLFHIDVEYESEGGGGATARVGGGPFRVVSSSVTSQTYFWEEINQGEALSPRRA